LLLAALVVVMVMKENSKILSIIAYYLSEYDSRAINDLGFKSATQAFEEISLLFGRNKNYIKLRRDEFDALPDSSSHRRGWKNRPPAKEVISIAGYLKGFSYTELTQLVESFLKYETNLETVVLEQCDVLCDSETDIENIINFKDDTSVIKLKEGLTAVRFYNRNIITSLKLLYKGKCQICNKAPSDLADISEAHHIEYFSITQNNDANNIIILCPNHHRLIHRLNPKFDYETLSFLFPNGAVESVAIDFHLGHLK
jgi:hypothetical protein